MLTVITLQVIDNIFQALEKKPSMQAQMLYINCLIHHFRGKPLNEAEAVQFELFKDDIPLYFKWRSVFQRLHKSGLVSIEDDRVVFYNKWGEHIDRTLLDRAPDDYDGDDNFHPASKFHPELRDNSELAFHLCRKYKIDKEKYITLVDDFISEQNAIHKRYQAYFNCVSHFNNWVKYNVDKPAESVVKSTRKRIGD